MVKNYDRAGFAKDIHGQPYPIIGFGTGKKRPTQNRMDDLVINLKDSDICHPVQGPQPKQGEKYRRIYLRDVLSSLGWDIGDNQYAVYDIVKVKDEDGVFCLVPREIKKSKFEKGE